MIGVPASPSGSRASHEAASCTASSPKASIPNAALLEGARYSPNLRAWLLKHGSNRPWRNFGIYRVDEDGALYVGYAEDDGYFIGANLNNILCYGRKAGIWAYGHLIVMTNISDFWERYAAIGRCAIDEAHSRIFVGDETRWLTNGDTRSCLWCGNHTQQLRRWNETIERVRWEPAPAIEARRADTPKSESVEVESAVRDSGDAQTTNAASEDNTSASPQSPVIDAGRRMEGE